MILVGMGGIFAEIMEDTILASPVATKEAATALIHRLKGAAVLTGARVAALRCVGHVPVAGRGQGSPGPGGVDEVLADEVQHVLALSQLHLLTDTGPVTAT